MWRGGYAHDRLHPGARVLIERCVLKWDRDYAANHDIFMRQGAAIQVRLDCVSRLSPSGSVGNRLSLRCSSTPQAQFRENASVVDERVKMVRQPVSPAAPRCPAADARRNRSSWCLFALSSASHIRCLLHAQTMLLEGEAMLNKHKHPDPYILSWRPGGTQYHRNPPPVPEVRLRCFPDPFPPNSISPLTLRRLFACLQMCAQLPFSQ